MPAKGAKKSKTASKRRSSRNSEPAPRRKKTKRDQYRPNDEYKVPAKPKQTGQPKRPMSSYMLWAADRRPVVREENPDLKMTEIAKLLGAEWSALDKAKDKQVKKYVVQAAKLKEEYDAVREEYVASTAYKKWKRDVKRWNETYKEEWQEQQWELKEQKAAAKKKREERKAEKEKEAKKGKKGKKKAKAQESEEEEEDSEDTEMEEAEDKKKKRGRKRKS